MATLDDVYRYAGRNQAISVGTHMVPEGYFIAMTANRGGIYRDFLLKGEYGECGSLMDSNAPIVGRLESKRGKNDVYTVYAGSSILNGEQIGENYSFEEGLALIVA